MSEKMHSSRRSMHCAIQLGVAVFLLLCAWAVLFAQPLPSQSLLPDAPAAPQNLLAQAAAKADELQLFIPITAPIRWSLVANRIAGFAGNRVARHTLTDLEQKPGSGD